MGSKPEIKSDIGETLLSTRSWPKKFEFWDLNLAIRIDIKNKPGIENMRSHNFQKMFKIFNSKFRYFNA